MKTLLSMGLCSILILNLAGCGTLLYPERKGQADGRLDPAVVLLDAAGLLLFLVPGIVAFAVDFANGTIYLPGGLAYQMTDEEKARVATNGHVDKQALKALIDEKMPGRLDAAGSDPFAQLEVREVSSMAELRTLFRQHQPVQIATM